jgi:hypothetical protein
VSDNFAECLSYLLLSSGLGGLTPNTVVLGMPELPTSSELMQFCKLIKVTKTLKKAIVVVKDMKNFPHDDMP